MYGEKLRDAAGERTYERSFPIRSDVHREGLVGDVEVRDCLGPLYCLRLNPRGLPLLVF